MGRSADITPEGFGDEFNPPPGWPRPHVVAQYEGEAPKINYLQWISTSPSDQIMFCHNDKLWTAGAYNLCSNCAHAMEQGLMWNWRWANENTPDEHLGRRTGRYHLGSDVGRFRSTDNHYGSPLCYRCALFALKHCPFFSELDRVYGDDLRWFVITSADQYHEIDTTGAVEPVRPNELQQITTTQIREKVHARRLHLMDQITVEDLPPLVRPWPDTTQPCYSPEQVRALARSTRPD